MKPHSFYTYIAFMSKSLGEGGVELRVSSSLQKTEISFGVYYLTVIEEFTRRLKYYALRK